MLLRYPRKIRFAKKYSVCQKCGSVRYGSRKSQCAYCSLIFATLSRCVICMIDFELNDKIKYLPCLHTFHQTCIDQWLLRSLSCPSCMEPIDVGLLAAFDNWHRRVNQKGCYVSSQSAMNQIDVKIKTEMENKQNDAKLVNLWWVSIDGWIQFYSIIWK